MNYLLNKKITFPDGLEGIIRYIGPVDDKEGKWVGLELETPIGRNDGSINGKYYFKCAEKCGLFVRYNRIENKIENTLNKSILWDDELKESSGKFFEHEYLTNKLDCHDKKKLQNEEFGNQSLFLEEFPRNELGNVVNKHLHILEEEKNILEATCEEYKSIFFTIIERMKSALERIRDRISEINQKVIRLQKIEVEEDEKSRVLHLLSKIYYEEKNGNEEKLYEYLNEFKNIMIKYNIEVN